MESDKDAIFHQALHSVGDDGIFQKRFNYFYNCVLVGLSSMIYLNIVLMMAIPDHWCHVPGRNLTNYTIDEWKELTLPSNKNSRDKISLSSCEMYNNTRQSLLDTGFRNIIPCQYGYEYDTTWYLATIPSDQDWVCDKDLYVTNVFAMIRVGEVVGTFVFGQLGDRIGRRIVFWMSLFILVSGRLLSIFTTSWYAAFATAICLGALAGPSIMQSILIITMETTKIENIGHIQMTQCIGWTSGLVLMPLLMWATRDWFIFGLISTIPAAIFLIPNKYLIESPRWLMSRCKFNKSEKMLKRIADINGTTLDKNAIQEMNQASFKPETVYGIVSLFTSIRLALSTIIIIICWIVGGLTYFALILNITNIGGNPYLNFLYQSAVELPAYVLGRVVSDKFGRRLTATCSFTTAATTAIALAFTVNDESLQVLEMILPAVIRFAISINFYVVCLQSMEIYPTCLRQTGISIGTIVSNAVGILGPYIVYLGVSIDARYPYAILAIALIIAGFSSMFLPETLYVKLPETLAEAREFGKDQTFWSLPKKPKTIDD